MDIEQLVKVIELLVGTSGPVIAIIVLIFVWYLERMERVNNTEKTTKALNDLTNMLYVIMDRTGGRDSNTLHKRERDGA